MPPSWQCKTLGSAALGINIKFSPSAILYLFNQIQKCIFLNIIIVVLTNWYSSGGQAEDNGHSNKGR